MQMNIIKERQTPLLSRKRITAEIEYEGVTPSTKEITLEISNKTKADIKLVEVRHIYNKFGATKAKVIAHVYDNPEIMKKIICLGKKGIEKIKKAEEAEKKKAEEAKKAAEEAKAAPKEEAPAEEKTAEEAK